MLFDKWCGNNPNLGLSNHFELWYQSLVQNIPDYKIHLLHYDESLMLYNKHIDSFLVQYCQAMNINVLFLSIGGHSPSHPSVETIGKIKSLGIFVCMFWADSHPHDLETQDRFNSVVNIYVSADHPRSEIHDARMGDPKYLRLWTPLSRFLYYPDKQDIDVSFIGSYRYPKRQEYITKILEKVPDLFIAGGQRESNLTAEEYAKFIRKSKIGINFSRSSIGDYSQLKSRVVEVIASKSLLIDEKNQSTDDFFEDGRDYVSFSDADDLIEKIQFYRENPELREKIASQGYNTYIEKWTAKSFWGLVFDKMKL